MYQGVAVRPTAGSVLLTLTLDQRDRADGRELRGPSRPGHARRLNRGWAGSFAGRLVVFGRTQQDHLRGERSHGNGSLGRPNVSGARELLGPRAPRWPAPRLGLATTGASPEAQSAHDSRLHCRGLGRCRRCRRCRGPVWRHQRVARRDAVVPDFPNAGSEDWLLVRPPFRPVTEDEDHRWSPRSGPPA